MYKGNEPTSLGEVALRRLNHTTQARPNFNNDKAINPTHLQREGGREGENVDKLQTASWFTIEDKLLSESWTTETFLARPCLLK